MKDLLDFGRTILAFPFGLLSETFARIALLIQPDLDVDFNYLSSQNKRKQNDTNINKQHSNTVWALSKP